MATNLRPSATSFGCMMLFLSLLALPFVAFGLGMGVWMGCDVVTYLNMQGWEETPAKIVGAKLENDEAKAEYVYEYRGRRYTGCRVGLHGGGDNIGSFQQAAYRELGGHQKSGRPFPCYVNPARPDEAVLYRNLRWEIVGGNAVFVLVFGGIGFGLLAIGVFGWRKVRADAAAAASHPDEPWLCKADWAAGNIRPNPAWSALVLSVIALYWNLLSAAVWLMIREQVLGNGDPLFWLLLIVPAVGLTLIVAAVISFLRRHKYGQSVFQMASVPGVIGGQLAGVICTSAKIRPENGFRLTLNCIPDANSKSERIVWQNEQVVARELLQSDADRSAIPVLFSIPCECLKTNTETFGQPVTWRLEVTASTPGIDYRTAFDVPVFKTGESNPQNAADDGALAGYVVPADPERDLRDAGVVRVVSPTGEGCRFVFGMGRDLGGALGLSVFWLIWTGATLVTLCLQAILPILLVFLIVFGLFDVAILVSLLNAWFYRSVIDVSHRGLSITGGIFGLGRTRWIESSDVTGIETAATNRFGTALVVYRDLVVVSRDGKRIMAAKGISGNRLATAVIGQIEQAMGKA